MSLNELVFSSIVLVTLYALPHTTFPLGQVFLTDDYGLITIAGQLILFGDSMLYSILYPATHLLFSLLLVSCFGDFGMVHVFYWMYRIELSYPFFFSLYFSSLFDLFESDFIFANCELLNCELRSIVPSFFYFAHREEVTPVLFVSCILPSLGKGMETYARQQQSIHSHLFV